MPHQLITIFEDRRQKLDLSSTEKDDILSFQAVLGSNNVSLNYDGTLQVMHYVGFISKGNTRLQILPKIYENSILDNENEKHEAIKVLLNLLRVSKFNKILNLPEQSSSVENSDILELFISIFAAKVLNLYSRQMHREYIDIVENSPFIKGKIEFTENARSNFIRRDRHIIRYQNFEHDNLINNVIKTVCVRLLIISRSSENKKNLKNALVFLDDAQEIVLSKELINSVIFTQLNMSFKLVYEMAKMFFFGLAPESFLGSDSIFSFLVPLNELYEYYLFKVLDGLGVEYSAQYQNHNLFVKSEDDKTLIRKIIPDILVFKSKVLDLIVDAKYKNPGYVNGSYSNINQADIYQVFTYAKVYGISRVALIYPQFDEAQPPSQIYFLNDFKEKVSLYIACIDIKNSSFIDNRMYLNNILYCKTK